MPIETFVLQGMLPADVFAPGSLTKGAWLTQDFFESSEKGWAQLPQGWNVFFFAGSSKISSSVDDIELYSKVV